MTVFRILEATARPGSIDRLSELLVQQERDVVAVAPGVVFAQTLRSGDQVLAVSSWDSVEAMERYIDQDVTRDFYQALPELLMGTPSIRTYEVISPDYGGVGPGWLSARSGEGGGQR